MYPPNLDQTLTCELILIIGNYHVRMFVSRMLSWKTSWIFLHLRQMRTPPTHQTRVLSAHALMSMRKFRSWTLSGLILQWVRLLTWQQSTPSPSVQLTSPLMDKKLKFERKVFVPIILLHDWEGDMGRMAQYWQKLRAEYFPISPDP